MHSRVFSSSVFGIEGTIVCVEVDLSSGLPAFSVVGLADQAVRESKDRVRAALLNCGFKTPVKRITVNLAPADVKKEGSLFDLPIAVGIIKSSGLLVSAFLEKTVIFGELSLDGFVRPVCGVLPMAYAAMEKGYDRLVLPLENAPEASVVEGIDVYGFSHLVDVVGFLNGETCVSPVERKIENDSVEPGISEVDFSEVKGQEYAKRVIEIAASGGHNILMVGPPGSGKTMLAKRLPTVLPPMSLKEAIESTKIHSVAGMNNVGGGLLQRRPFRSPHHTISYAGLVGGGQIPRPGEISLAHNGVLFLDELPEFSRNVLEVLRQPLEDGKVTISRSQASMDFPASFLLTAAMNPCPCGYRSDPTNTCVCTYNQIKRYVSKISGPLLDRMDLGIWVPAVKIGDLIEPAASEDSSAIRSRIITARALQKERFDGMSITCNSQIPPKKISTFCVLEDEEKSLMKDIASKFNLSARGFHRTLKVARSVADLDGSRKIKKEHLMETVQYRPHFN